jgi:hypothetical protein
MGNDFHKHGSHVSFAFLSDCYVAICGVPTPRADHAVAMARFATECLSKMNALTKELEAQLVC